jgi:hypothetical protein
MFDQFLTKLEKKIIAEILESNGDISVFINSNYSNERGNFLRSLANKYGDNKIEELLVYLDSKGFIRIASTKDGKTKVTKIYRNALQYKELNRIEVSRFISRSVITPIFVSLITVLLSPAIFSIFKVTLLWLSQLMQ